MTRLLFSERVKFVAALVLFASAFLPLYALRSSGDVSDYCYPWQLAREDPGSAVVLAFAYFWPVLVLGLRRLPHSTGWRVTALICEAALAFVSGFILWLLPATAFGFAQPFGPWLLIPVGASFAVGGVVGLAADIAYLVALTAAAVGLRRATGLARAA
jgi:hypothetical protein